MAFVIPDYLYLSSRNSLVCDPELLLSVIPDFPCLSSRTSLVCHPGLDPGSMAFYRRLQWAAMGYGSRVFARDDNIFTKDDKNRAALACQLHRDESTGYGVMRCPMEKSACNPCRERW